MINGLTKVEARFALVPVLSSLSLWFDVNVNLSGNVGDLLPCDERMIFLLSSNSTHVRINGILKTTQL